METPGQMHKTTHHRGILVIAQTRWSYQRVLETPGGTIQSSTHLSPHTQTCFMSTQLSDRDCNFFQKSAQNNSKKQETNSQKLLASHIETHNLIGRAFFFFFWERGRTGSYNELLTT
jgi:hypothetical protein